MSLHQRIPAFTGNPMKQAPRDARLRVWTQAGGLEDVGRFGEDGVWTSERDGFSSYGDSYCRIEDADTGELYYDNGWHR